MRIESVIIFQLTWTVLIIYPKKCYINDTRKYLSKLHFFKKKTNKKLYFLNMLMFIVKICEKYWTNISNIKGSKILTWII